jgi:hypothetical protein
MSENPLAAYAAAVIVGPPSWSEYYRLLEDIAGHRGTTLDKLSEAGLAKRQTLNGFKMAANNRAFGRHGISKRDTSLPQEALTNTNVAPDNGPADICWPRFSLTMAIAIAVSLQRAVSHVWTRPRPEANRRDRVACRAAEKELTSAGLKPRRCDSVPVLSGTASKMLNGMTAAAKPRLVRTHESRPQ